MLKQRVIFVLAVPIMLASAYGNDYMYNHLDGKPFGYDGMPLSCDSTQYQMDGFFGGNGEVLCAFARRLNQTATLTTLTTQVAVTIKMGIFCEFKLSAIGSKSLSFMSENYPLTWNIVRTRVLEDPAWGKIEKEDCSLVRLSDSGNVFQ